MWRTIPISSTTTSYRDICEYIPRFGEPTKVAPACELRGRTIGRVCAGEGTGRAAHSKARASRPIHVAEVGRPPSQQLPADPVGTSFTTLYTIGYIDL